MDSSSKFRLTMLIFLLCRTFVFAIDNKIDSLRTVLTKSLDDSSKVKP